MRWSSVASKNAKGEKKTVNYVACVLTLSGTVGGTSAQATSAIESFRDSLPSLSVFKSLKMEKPALLKNFERDRALDIYTFTITLELRT